MGENVTTNYRLAAYLDLYYGPYKRMRLNSKGKCEFVYDDSEELRGYIDDFYNNRDLSKFIHVGILTRNAMYDFIRKNAHTSDTMAYD